jgi:hypothetical protein
MKGASTGIMEPGVTARHAAATPAKKPEIKINSRSQGPPKETSGHREILRPVRYPTSGINPRRYFVVNP